MCFQFREIVITESYISRYGEKVDEEFIIYARPVMDCIKEIVHDPLIAPLINWFPSKKYLINADLEDSEQFWDDLDCGEKWWKIQVF